jgi:CO/xanthine dehydrogenase FAD-binding subunit
VKPAPFDYEAPTDLDGAIGLLDAPDRDAKVIAGGQSLLPLMNLRLARPGVLVDIARIDEISGWSIDTAGQLVIGAGATQAEVMSAPEVQMRWPVLVRAISFIGHPQIRNRGTVCGSLAHHDPAAELPATATALDAVMTIKGPGGWRELPAADMFVGLFTTALEPGELLARVTIPPLPPATGWAFVEVARRRGDFAVAGIAVLVNEQDGQMAAPRLVACGAGATPVRLRAAEDLLEGRVPSPALLREAARATAVEADPPGDVHVDAATRREVIERLVLTGVVQAWERCR